MRAMTFTPRHKAVIRLGLLGPALLLSACQVVAAKGPPAPRVSDQASASTAALAPTPTSVNQAATYTIKRDTLQTSLNLAGKVVPGRSAQLAFRGNGTVTAVNVASGQTVHQGDVLAELALDADSLQTLRAQATLADLAYQSEQAKLDDLQSAKGDSVQQLRVTIEKDQAEIQKLQQEQAGSTGANVRADQALAAAKTVADRKVDAAQAALQSAVDVQTTAQTNVKNAQDDVLAGQDKAATDAQQAADDAATAASAASGAVRAAQRQLDEANITLSQAKMEWSTTRAQQALESQQLKVDQDKDAQADAKAVLEAASGPTVAGATANVRGIDRAIAADLLELKHLQTNLDAAKTTDTAAIKVAGFGVEALKEQLANLQLAEKAAQQKAQRLAKQVAAGPSRGSQQSVDAAKAALKQADAAVRAATINLDDARAAAQAAADATTTPAEFADHSLQAAQAQLSADQSRMQTLQSGASGTEIARQQTRVSLLRDQSVAATAAAQPTVSLKAPFDANVADVGVSVGQALAPSDGATGGGQTPALRLVAIGTNSIVADASESDVAQLNQGQQMDLSFPSLPGQSTRGTIVEIASTGTVNKDNQVSYPIRIDVATPPPALKFGMTAQASMAVAQAKDVLVAPRRAIRNFGGQTLVDKLDPNGQVSAVPVQVGGTYGGNVELVGGVNEGDVVAIYDPVTAGPKQP